MSLSTKRMAACMTGTEDIVLYFFQLCRSSKACKQKGMAGGPTTKEVRLAGPICSHYTQCGGNLTCSSMAN